MSGVSKSIGVSVLWDGGMHPLMYLGSWYALNQIGIVMKISASGIESTGVNLTVNPF